MVVLGCFVGMLCMDSRHCDVRVRAPHTAARWRASHDPLTALEPTQFEPAWLLLGSPNETSTHGHHVPRSRQFKVVNEPAGTWRRQLLLQLGANSRDNIRGPTLLRASVATNSASAHAVQRKQSV